MIDDLLNKINEVIDGEESENSQDGATVGSSTHIVVGDIVNNQGTIVIGGDLNQGRRQEDHSDDDSAHGRRASDRQVHAEVRALRGQLTRLKRQLTGLYDTCLKRCPHRRPPCRKPSGANTPAAPSVSNHRHPRPAPGMLSTSQRKPAPRLASRPSIAPNIPPNPIHSLVSIPDRKSVV